MPKIYAIKRGKNWDETPSFDKTLTIKGQIYDELIVKDLVEITDKNDLMMAIRRIIEEEKPINATKSGVEKIGLFATGTTEKTYIPLRPTSIIAIDGDDLYLFMHPSIIDSTPQTITLVSDGLEEYTVKKSNCIFFGIKP